MHWKTSARLRRRVSVERDGETAGAVEVVVERPAGQPDEQAEAFERSVGRATGAVVVAFDDGAEVTLRLPGEVLPPVSGPSGRETLLRRLAVVRLERT